MADASVNSPPRGVAPSRNHLYTSKGAENWKCLDGSKSIPYAAINDDYCDCADGSDEPGTSACGTGYFYCANAGHLPAYIKTSRLNDGVCDPECCDGSDEFRGTVQCPNICEQVGKEAKEERDRVRKIEKEGGKIRQGYITYGAGAKKKLQKQLNSLQAKFSAVQQKANEIKAAFDEANAKREEYLRRTKIEREAARKAQLAPITEQQRKRLAHATDVKSGLRAALEELKEKYNKNYHDLVVKDTITGFEEYLKEMEQETSDIATGEVQNTEGERTADEIFHALQDRTRDVRKDIGKLFQLLKVMKRDHNVEYNDEAVLKAIKHMDDFAPTWQDDHNDFVGEELIEVPKDNFEASEQREEWERTQEAHGKASEAERKLQSEIQDLEQKLSMDYGKDETFAQLVEKCFEYKDMEYTYSLCLFGEALQKSHSSTSLGKFSKWIGDNYDTQLYTGGTKCWNGPERSVKVVMSCGVVNEIVAVSEPSKCEYLYKFRTPAACRVISDKDVAEDMDMLLEAVMPSEATVAMGTEATKKHDEL
ncbi:hypothetical protein BGZ70_006784 [Mortierella alpina]|uniref:Glucosidase 2 subunit beta n=1 Tax=Mortierella alpina TaxID=64518 RepID=A0A9P6J7S5_MORAP|nr:hypothetical protein BGZ70_006784 [Mortierella alpina]